MKLKLVAPSNGTNCLLVDDDTGNTVGEIYSSEVTPEFMSKFQGAKIVLDGKSLKRVSKSSDVVCA